jgi:signal transduction histidine kinase
VLASTSVFLFLQLRSTIDRSIDQFLRVKALSMAAQLTDRKPGRAGPKNSDRVFTGVIGRRGRVLSSTFPGGHIPASTRIRNIQHPVRFERTLRTGGESLQARLLALPTGAGEVVVIASSLEGRQATLGHLATFLWIGVPGVLIAATVIVWLLAGAALRPVDRLRMEADAISGTDPSRRLTIPSSGDEIERLARTLNELLKRIESAMSRERRFVNNASHELRTPLGILRTEIDLALNGPRSVDELRAALESSGQEAEQLARVAEDLLVLARSENGSLSVRPISTDIEALIKRVVGDHADRARQQHVSVVTTVDVNPIEVDPIWTRQALTNLLDNALRHMPYGGRAEVRVGASSRSIVLSVSDTGEGFDETSLADVFEPFARPDTATSGEMKGAGLGLAIVQAIAAAHGGSAIAKNLSQGGASVALEIPLKHVGARSDS